MRWKLLIITTLVTVLVGASSALALIYFFVRPVRPFTFDNYLSWLALLAPLAALIYAAIFVYRHTARRRKLQAMLFSIVAGSLTATLIGIGTHYLT